MLCHRCHGQHWVVRGGQMAPCPECGGMGEVHCCEGLIAQQEPAAFACPVVVPSHSPEETVYLGRPVRR
jgi:hypothetical protein